jgi:amino acid adenylation domain-containing protein
VFVPAGPELTASLKELARREGATLFMVLVAGFFALLHRYTGEDDIVIGCPVAGRGVKDVEGLVGLFVNTIAVRADLSRDPTFRELLGRVRGAVLDAQAHQEIPFEKIVETLGLPRDRSHHPVFQVMLAFQNAFSPTIELPGLTARVIHDVDLGTSVFDLTLAVMEDQGDIVLKAEHSTDLFEPETILRLLTHLKNIFGAAVRAPEERVSALRMLSAEERRRILVDWNETPAPYAGDPGRALADDLLTVSAARSPDHTAIAWGDLRISYRELEARVNRLASYLQKRGVGPDVIVAIYMDRVPAYIVAILAILRAGGAYLPLDPIYPEERLAFMLRDAGARIILARGSEADRLASDAVRVVSLDSERDAIDREPDTAPARAGASPRNLAYIVFTSGSTGRPKGVAIEHGGLHATALAQIQAFGVRAESRILQFFSFAFDGSVSELFMTLAASATLCMVPEAAREPGIPLFETLRDQAITVTCLAPSVLALLPQGDLPALRTLIVGGEACSPDLIARFAPGRRFFNAYGPTEVTIGVSTAELSVGQKPLIGRPFQGKRMYILDRRGEPVPPGVAGEIAIGGAGVARGYQRRPALTAERFLPDPFSSEPGARLYRTGDLGRYLPDGNVEFLGRLDHQVKIRGYRVELGEIEAVLADIGRARDVAVLLREDKPGEARLVAYLVKDADEFMTATELRERCRERLPEYMIPQDIVFLDAIPLTSNGKVDAAALPSPSGDREERGRAYVPPRDAIERALVEIWEDLLGARPIGITESFFDRGGHSLLAVRLMSRIAERTQKRLPLATLFESSTIERLAVALRGEGAARASPLCEVRKGGAEPPIFCVHPVGGSILCFRELAARLGEERSMYGLSSVGIEGEEPPLSSIDAMAERYTAEVLKERPNGPYLLVGYSLGGSIALEMARRLRARGEDVPLLALIDAAPFDTWGIRGDVDEATLLHLFLIDLQARTGSAAADLDDLRVIPPEERFAHALARAKGAGAVPPEIDPARFEQLFRVFAANIRALLTYAPEPYEGPATLIRAEGSEGARGRAEQAWRRVARGGLTLLEAPGDHDTVLSGKNAAAVAKLLSSAVESGIRMAGSAKGRRTSEQNTSMSDLEAFLEEARQAIGAENVVIDERQRAAAETATFETSQRIPAIVRPSSTAEVQAIVRAARRHGAPLYPVSGGKNWSYGSRVPLKDGSVLLDLGRMDRIHEHDDKLGYVVVEPGVTMRKLADYLEAKGSRLMISVTGSSVDSSYLGNTLERGVGVGPNGDRFSSTCALEVVLPDGELLNTGFLRFPGARATHAARFGVGPYIDGLFTQSNLGIVTRMTAWLAPRPKSFQTFLGTISDPDRLPALVDALRELALAGVLRGTFALWNDYKYISAMKQYPWDEAGGKTPLPRDLLKKLLSSAKMGTWNVVGALYSASKAHGEAERDIVKKTLKDKVDKLIFIDERLVGVGRALASPVQKLFRFDLGDMLDRLYTKSSFLGYPTGAPIAQSYWRKRAAAPSEMDPDRDRCGVICAAPSIPFDGQAVVACARIIEEESLKASFEPNISLVCVNARQIDVIALIVYDRDTPGEDERAMACHDAMVRRLVAEGFVPYRLGVQSMSALPPAEGAYDRLVGSIKDLLDPDEILAPGRYIPPRSGRG